MPKRIHSAASLSIGTSSRSRLATTQADATRDPMSSSRDHAQASKQTEVGRGSVPHDQAHWQDEYATNWDRVGMGRNASSSDAAAAAMQQVSCPSGLHDEPEGRPSKGKAWACKLCTFAENPSHSIRCEVCETVRGSTLQDYRPAASAAASAAAPADVETDRGKTQPALVTPVIPAAHASSMRSRRPTSKQQQRSIAGFLGPGVSKQSEASILKHEAGTAKQDAAGEQYSQHPACISTSDWARVDFHTEVRWQCAKCKSWFQTGQKAEHDDYHLALELHQQTTAGPARTLSSVKRHKPCKACD